MSAVSPTGKVIIEEEMKEEMKEDVDPHNGADDGKCGACPTPPLRPGTQHPTRCKASLQGAATRSRPVFQVHL